MADVIASQVLEKAQALHEAVLALGVVVELYMTSSGKNVDDMIYIVNHLFVPIDVMADELLFLVREVAK